MPIVFVNTIDPVGGGWVEGLSRPGTNATGFASFEFSMSGKWLELLKEIAPGVKRVAVIRDPLVPAGSGGLAAIQTVAPSLGVELTPVGVRDADETYDRSLRARSERRPDPGRTNIIGAEMLNARPKPDVGLNLPETNTPTMDERQT